MDQQDGEMGQKMKNYIFDCNGCACGCRIVLKDSLAIPRHCPTNEGMPAWIRVGEFEKHEEAPGETDALRVHNKALGAENEKLQKEIINLGYRYKCLQEWISALLALGTSGLENITGGKAGEK